MQRRTVLVGLVGAATSALLAGCRRVAPTATLRRGYDVGTRAEVDEMLAAGPLYVPEARAYLVGVPEAVRDDVAAAFPAEVDESVRAGYLALWQQCPHLGCRVPRCDSSGWFECPCHGSAFTEFGEHRGGPSPRGMDLFTVDVGERIRIGVEVIDGVARDVDASGSMRRGPGCLGGG